MNNTSKLFKTLLDNEFKKLNLEIQKDYYYFVKNGIKNISDKKFEDTNETNAYHLVDEDYDWNPKEQKLYLNLKIKMENLNILFGQNGVCYNDTILGLGMVWKPNNSRIKKCVKFGEISNSECKKEFAINDIELGDISSNTVFELIIYVVSPGTNDNKSFFGNEKGLILYQTTLWSLIVEGEGSIFPIVDIPEVDGVLWKYDYNFEDIAEDEFSEEHVRIILNPSHSSYPMLQPKDKSFDQNFLAEVMSSALSMIIMTIRYKCMEDGNDKINLKKQASKGSILQALQYFNSKLKFDINGSFSDLSKSIKSFFNKGV